MTWAVLVFVALTLNVAAWSAVVRRQERRRWANGLGERAEARATGSARARLQYPEVDLGRCIGCGVCVEACPEEGVLEIVHGQALVVHGARCVGHGRCAVECPVGAVAVTLGDLSQRRDVPVLSAELESTRLPGLFLAGEITGFALIRTAIAHGKAVAAEVALRPRRGPEVAGRDLVIVGCGPAGIACALEAKLRGLDFEVIDQDGLGGTVAHYPRRKLVMTQPVELPLHGKLTRTSYSKEELIELWQDLAREHRLPLRTGVTLQGMEPTEEGGILLQTSAGPLEARHVCLALGRRGTPRKLGVPGEDTSQVVYALVDASAYQDADLLVVGGGDSAVEAAMGLAEQSSNRVTISYRRGAFFRLKARNQRRLETLLARGSLTALFESQVLAVEPGKVTLQVGKDGESGERTIPNDQVFVLAGGEPPFALLERCGVSFDPAERPDQEPGDETGSGLVRSLVAASLVAILALLWTWWHSGYYSGTLVARLDHADHDFLRPGRGAGLALGIVAAALVLANLLYLLRRAGVPPLGFASLRTWMTAHMATGIGALLLAMLHGALAPRPTVGGLALLCLLVLVATGAIGRWVYAALPRAANGRELALEEVRERLDAQAADWDREHRSFGTKVRCALDEEIHGVRWKGSLPRRLWELVLQRRRIQRRLAAIGEEGIAQGIPRGQIDHLQFLAQREQHLALAATRYEDLRTLLGSWRWLHRCVALLLVLLLALHIASALRFGSPGTGVGS